MFMFMKSKPVVREYYESSKTSMLIYKESNIYYEVFTGKRLGRKASGKWYVLQGQFVGQAKYGNNGGTERTTLGVAFVSVFHERTIKNHPSILE